MVYTVVEWIDMMEAADRAPGTIRAYRIIFESFGKFLDVPVSEIHNHLSAENLIKYAGYIKNLSGQTIRQRLAILRAYFEDNDIVFTRAHMRVLGARRYTEPDDKPLELETLQKMMDLGDERARAFITVMVSTGMRAGETAKLRLSDIDGDTVTIPGTVTKTKRGRRAYLTSEAREYLDIWLHNRAEFIRLADIHTGVLQDHGITSSRPKHDDRLFACSYTSLNAMFKRLYQKVDGERGRYRHRITPHSMRKYFRTQAAGGGLHVDIVEHVMGHSGYLTSSYVRLTEDEIRRKFHEHEAALYITRPDQRVQDGELAQLRQKVAGMGAIESRLAAVEVLLEHPELKDMKNK